MQVRIAIIFRHREKSTYQWQLSMPHEEFFAVGAGRHINVSVGDSNMLLRFDPDGRAFGKPPLGRFMTCSFVPNALPELGVPIRRCAWWVEAKQISTNPVSFSLTLPDMTGCVDKPSSANDKVYAAPYSDMKTAMELLNERLLADPSVKVYVRPDGTVGARVLIDL